MTPKRVVLRGLSAAVVIIAAVLFLYSKTNDQPVSPDAGARPDASPAQPAAPAAVEREEPSHPAAAAVEREVRLAPSARKYQIDKEARAAMLAKILQSINESSPANASGERSSFAKASEDRPSSAKATEGLPKEYIQQQVREIVPLIRECYEMALEQDPELGGNLKVQFTIVGDEDYGGLVEDSKILDDSSLATHAGITECVRETMYAIQLKAPEGGGRIVVTYPFIFKSVN